MRASGNSLERACSFGCALPTLGPEGPGSFGTAEIGDALICYLNVFSTYELCTS